MLFVSFNAVELRGSDSCIAFDGKVQLRNLDQVEDNLSPWSRVLLSFLI